MRPNRVLVGTGLWLLSVVTVAGLAWFAIDSAGDSVSGPPDVAVIPVNADGPGGSPAGTGTSTGRSIGVPAVSSTSSSATTTSPPPPPRVSQPVSRTYSGAAG